MHLVDLSLTLGPEVEPVPGHPHFEARPLTTLERDGVNNSLITLSIHTGTHIDAPYHFIKTGQTIDQIPLEKLCGRAWLCDLRASVRHEDSMRHRITVEDLQGAGLPNEGLADTILTIFTGWSAEHWNRADFYTQNPFLDEQTSRWLMEQRVKALALDHGIDGAKPWPNHTIVLSEGCCIIENLVNLDAILPQRAFTMYALPVKMRENGGMARVIAQLD
ncbi:cyclase family protein [Ktedonosporobacter rubrisoli]|uniref:Cyclase family protein n=1 Tax=Ktedonosporobacter rubrisoli TaxID=2509675 RepID=A0A4V0YYW3_KTERU|nr:cyclase family protein [Ktedonosporobacter rubrisoli]QBD77621.1 cyclase family protein [Ktedonosporobacter rubrisoli]